MSTTIPNVSSIFRDLTHISSTANRVTNDQSYSTNYQLDTKPNHRTENNCFEDLYAYKQKRHRQLMGKLKNSYEEHRSLVEGQSSRPEQYNNYDYSSIKRTSAYQQPDIGSRTKSNGYVIPKIKYRHIEDFVKYEPITQSTKTYALPERDYIPSHDYVKLQDEFYEDGNIPARREAKTSTNFAQGLNDEDLQDQKSHQTNKNFSKINKNVKYEDKIESYFSLCRKNLNSEKERQPTKSEKFVRTGTVNGKYKPMKLQEAIKLLSLD